MTTESALEHLEHDLRKQLVLYAVQREIFCQYCQGILDIDRAVLVDLQLEEHKTMRMTILCEPCWNKAKSKVTPSVIAAWGGHRLEVSYGKDGSVEIFNGDSAAVRQYEDENKWKQAKPDRSEAEITGEQQSLNLEEVSQ